MKLNHSQMYRKRGILVNKLKFDIRKSATLIFFLLFAFNTYAQTKDEVLLLEASSKYNKGAFTEVIDITDEIQDSASTSIIFQKYRLRALSQIAFAENEAALESVKQMLEINPTYRFNPITDPDELNLLIKRLKVIPKLNLGLSISIGSNTTYAKVTELYNVSRTPKTYTSKNTRVISIDGGYNFNNRSGIGISLVNAEKEYSVDYQVNDFNINLTEQLSYIDFPVYYKLKLVEIDKISFTIHMGGYMGYLYRANNQISSLNAQSNSMHEIRSFSAVKRKSKWNFGGVLGGSALYDLKKGSLVLNFMYYNGLHNITNTNVRYSNHQLLHDYYYIDDDLRLNNLSISLGYIINLNYQIERKKSLW